MYSATISIDYNKFIEIKKGLDYPQKYGNNIERVIRDCEKYLTKEGVEALFKRSSAASIKSIMDKAKKINSFNFYLEKLNFLKDNLLHDQT